MIGAWSVSPYFLVLIEPATSSILLFDDVVLLMVLTPTLILIGSLVVSVLGSQNMISWALVSNPVRSPHLLAKKVVPVVERWVMTSVLCHASAPVRMTFPFSSSIRTQPLVLVQGYWRRLKVPLSIRSPSPSPIRICGISLSSVTKICCIAMMALESSGLIVSCAQTIPKKDQRMMSVIEARRREE